MTLGDQVAELEDDYERLKADNRSLEENLNELEQDLEDMTNTNNELTAFYSWVKEVYPEIIKDYQSVKIIEEVANGIQE